MAMGESLGDGSAHRVAHNVNCPDVKVIENGGDVIGDILDFISL
jgi:hypothetical protein